MTLTCMLSLSSLTPFKAQLSIKRARFPAQRSRIKTPLTQALFSKSRSGGKGRGAGGSGAAICKDCGWSPQSHLRSCVSSALAEAMLLAMLFRILPPSGPSMHGAVACHSVLDARMQMRTINHGVNAMCMHKPDEDDIDIWFPTKRAGTSK